MPSKLYGDIEALKRTAYFLDVIGVTVYSKEDGWMHTVFLLTSIQHGLDL